MTESHRVCPGSKRGDTDPVPGGRGLKSLAGCLYPSLHQSHSRFMPPLQQILLWAEYGDHQGWEGLTRVTVGHGTLVTLVASDSARHPPCRHRKAAGPSTKQGCFHHLMRHRDCATSNLCLETMALGKGPCHQAWGTLHMGERVLAGPHGVF